MLTTLIVAVGVIVLATIVIVHAVEDEDKVTLIVAAVSGGFSVLALWLLVVAVVIEAFFVLN